jgi:hypothetical protein
MSRLPKPRFPIPGQRSYSISHPLLVQKNNVPFPVPNLRNRLKVVVYGRSFEIFKLINRDPISSHYRLIFLPSLDHLLPGRVDSDIVLVGGNVPAAERDLIVRRFEKSKTAVALLSPTSLRDWGRDRVIEGIFDLLQQTEATLARSGEGEGDGVGAVVPPETGAVSKETWEEVTKDAAEEKKAA